MANNIRPRQGQSYTVKEIIEDLYLRDSPALTFSYQGKTGVIQDTHMPNGDITVVPGMSESRWKYIRETYEWIPIFEFDTEADQPPITTIADLEPSTSRYDKPNTWWATPKGFPREQYT